MSFNPESLIQALVALADEAEAANRYLVAFSGGLDSTVLLHALAEADHCVPVTAVHVDHGLQSDSREWSRHCETIATGLGVDYVCRKARVDQSGGSGLEAAARDARYAALSDVMGAGDWIVSAHHRDDQAETLLLNLLRGGGPAGLAGIAAIRPFSGGFLARPLLGFSRQDLQDYAARHRLGWIEDPSNADHSFDRNYLRHEILPRLETRWPGTGRRLHRSSRIASDAALLLDELGAIDAHVLGDRPDRVAIDALQSLSPARQRNALRYRLRQLGLATPSSAQLQQVFDHLIDARDDALPLVQWGDVELRRYRSSLYILAAPTAETPPAAQLDRSRTSLDLGRGLGCLRLEHDAAQGLDINLLDAGLTVRFREGGERIRLVDQVYTKTLKNLLQEEGIVPWMRDRIPLLFAGEDLVAVADLWLSGPAATSPGVAVRWENRPSIH